MTTHTKTSLRASHFARASSQSGGAKPIQPSLNTLLQLLSFPGSAGSLAQSLLFEQRYFPAKEVIFPSNSASPELYAVRTGLLRTKFVDPLGPGYIVGFPKQGDLVGFEALTAPKVTVTTIAVTDVNLIVIPLNTAHKLMCECDAFSQGVYSVLAQYLKIARERIQFQTTLSAAGRVAKFLIDELDNPCSALGQNRIVFKMKRGDIASYLGISLETLIRTFNEFHDQGLIQRCNKIVEVVDSSRLRIRIYEK